MELDQWNEGDDMTEVSLELLSRQLERVLDGQAHEKPAGGQLILL